MDSIDSFVNLPLLIAAGAGLVLFILLLIAKIRNAAKISFIFFPCIGVLIAGLLYTYFDHKLFYISAITIVLEFFFIAYAFVLAVSDPVKRAERKAKKEKESEENSSSEEISKEALDALENKYKTIIEEDKELTVKASSYFNEENSLSQFLEFFNKQIVQKTGADGGAILVLDEFDNVYFRRHIKSRTIFRTSSFGLKQTSNMRSIPWKAMFSAISLQMASRKTSRTRQKTSVFSRTDRKISFA